jgi:hypothetical protein
MKICKQKYLIYVSMTRLQGLESGGKALAVTSIQLLRCFCFTSPKRNNKIIIAYCIQIAISRTLYSRDNHTAGLPLSH